MDNLCISITYLSPYFHGQGDYGPEWPPSPWRLFQAILATAARNQRLDRGVFEWFEKLDPPIILSPSKDNGSKKIKTYVPDNASDVILNRQGRLSEKIIEPSIIKNPETSLHYIWKISSEDIENATEIARIAMDLATVGWGIDLVVGNGKLMKDSEVSNLIETYPEDKIIPSRTIGKTLRYPIKGSYENLQTVHESKQNRFNGLTYTPPKRPSVYQETGYVDKGKPYRSVVCLKLLQPSDEAERWASFDPRYITRVSSWIRGFLCNIVENEWDFKESSEVYVAGHHDSRDNRTPPRFSFLPLPTIGHKNADGLIRRVIIAEPYGGDGSKSNWAEEKIKNATLCNEQGKKVCRIEVVRKDKIFERYCSSGTIFKSVTPVILPGHDSHKYSKAEKLFLKAIEQADLNVDDIDHYILHKAPFFNGGYHPTEYKLTAHLKGFTPIHVMIKWKSSVRGPLVIGAGRHRGLGLFVPTDDREERDRAGP